VLLRQRRGNNGNKSGDLFQRLVLAISKTVYDNFIAQDFAKTILEIKDVPFFVYNVDHETILKWIK
jgi:hypothetical protein